MKNVFGQLEESDAGILEIPIFPLPNVVFFPRTVLPLHIFEPRYRKMVEDSLNGDQRVGMVLLKPGGGQDSQGNPQIHPVGGLGIISDHVELEDGDCNIVLSGLSRFRLVEFIRGEPYRRARVRLIPELPPSSADEISLADRLVKSFEEFSSDRQNTQAALEVLTEADFQTLVNSISSSMPLAAQDKQVLLEIDSLGGRAEAILSVLSALTKQKRFVQDFAHLRPPDPMNN